MLKLTFLIIFLTSLVNAKPFNQTIIMIEPVSWEELQKIEFNDLKTKEELNLSNTCPTELAAFEQLDAQSTYFKEILWNHYFWTQFENTDGKICVIKHDTFDFFSEQPEEPPLKTPEYEILDENQASLLLNAVNSIGFDEKGIEILKINVSKHNSAVSDLKYAEYGGRNRMQYFLEKYTPEKEPIPYEEGVTFLQRFESNYTEETLDLFKNEVRKSSTKDRYDNKYPFNSFEELLKEVKNQINLKEEYKKKLLNKASSPIIKVPNNNIATPDPVIPGQYNPVYPYSTVGRSSASILCNGQYRSGTSFLVTSYVAITAAHNVICGYNIDLSPNFQPGLLTAGSSYFPPFSVFDVQNVKIAANYNYFDSSFNKAQFDYGAIRTETPFFEAGSLVLQIDVSTNEIRAVGFPINKHGMHQGEGSSFFAGNANGNVISYQVETEAGMSGGPLLDANTQITATYAKGIHGWGWYDAGSKVGSGVLIDSTVGNEISSWLWAPTGTVVVDRPTANALLNLVTLPDFVADFNPFNKINIYGEIVGSENVDDSIEWSSDINGTLATGSVVPSAVLKNKLTAGVHYITAKVDTNGEEGEKTVRVTIEVPQGQFNSPDYCIIDLASNPNSCQINIAWTVTNTPATSVVWNETDSVEFATGNSGSQTFFATTDSTTFKLYPSTDKIILLDTHTVDAKLPTGNLSVPTTQCSLQPTPVNPNGTLRDPNATPPGCGVELSWSNVTWAKPSIFYKPVNGGSWQLLHQVPCTLNGSVCEGSIHTDDIIPELINTGGYQFKLVQFNDANSANLSPTLTVIGKRFADVYEFDDGYFDTGNPITTHNLAMGTSITNPLAVNVTQHNHNFHRPRAGDSVYDVDTFDFDLDDLVGVERLHIDLTNMATSLRVAGELQCIGIRNVNQGPNETGVWTLPVAGVVLNSVYNSSNNSHRFEIKLVRDQNFLINPDPKNEEVWRVRCDRNRFVLNRTAGQPSENLSYSIKASIVNLLELPNLDSVAAMNTTTYKVELLGDNFGVNDPATLGLRVRENINGSNPLVTYSSEFFHNRGTYASTHPLAGKDFIRIPILKVARQFKFRDKGLCFRVLSGSLQSNEKCYKIPARTAKPGFMGTTVQSYNHTNSQQDIDSDAYVTKDNGNQLKLWGNSWKKIAKSYTVTPNTEFEVKFKSTHSEGEIIGVGFVMSGEANVSGARFWQLHGTQTDWGLQELNNYSGTGYKTYKIKIGEKFTGQISHIVFVGDYDNQQAAMNSVFEVPKLYERGITIDAYDDVPAQRAFDDDVNGRGGLWTGNAINNVVHNFHDAGDKDWVVIVAEDFKVRSELIGANAANKIQLYKWISATYDSNLGYYTQVNDVLLDESSNSWNVPLINWGRQVESYAVKVESLNGNFGVGTDYKLIFESIPNGTPDSYESGLSDDNEGTPSSWAGGDTEHLHNFHDNNDVDWTMVYAQNFTAFAQAIGDDADLKMTVYRWSDADYINGQFVNIVSHYYDQDNSPGNSTVQVNYHEPATFVIKVEARNGAYGNGTSYKLKLF